MKLYFVIEVSIGLDISAAWESSRALELSFFLQGTHSRAVNVNQSGYRPLLSAANAIKAGEVHFLFERHRVTT